MADFKLVTKNCIESVEKTHATENEKNWLASVIFLMNFFLRMIDIDGSTSTFSLYDLFCAPTSRQSYYLDTMTRFEDSKCQQLYTVKTISL